MRALAACVALVVLGSANPADPGDEHAKKQLHSDFYSIALGTAPAFDPEAELEIGDSSGHGGTLRWVRFQPARNGVDVLSIQLDEGRDQYQSKWPPDRVPVAVKRARMDPNVYAALLHDLAVVDSATLKPIPQNGLTFSSNNFWVFARLTTDKKTLLDLNWAGYESSVSDVKCAKPRAAVRLAREAIEGLEFKDHTLTEGERVWAGAKFTRDWKKFQGLDSHWFVQERYIQAIGVVGDESALPVLREILAAEPTNAKPRESSDGRCVYYAINAVTRLTKKDVRDRPVEAMNIEKTRLKILDLIKDNK